MTSGSPSDRKTATIRTVMPMPDMTMSDVLQRPGRSAISNRKMTR